MNKDFIKNCMIDNGKLLIYHIMLEDNSALIIYANKMAKLYERILLYYINDVPIWVELK